MTTRASLTVPQRAELLRLVGNAIDAPADSDLALAHWAASHALLVDHGSGDPDDELAEAATVLVAARQGLLDDLLDNLEP